MRTVSVMDAFHTVAARYGGVDPKDSAAVQSFFEVTLPRLSPRKQQQIFDAVLKLNTGIDSSLQNESTGYLGRTTATLKQLLHKKTIKKSAASVVR